MICVDMSKSVFVGFASKLVERRASMIPTLISFPSIGVIATTSLVMVGLAIIKYQNRRNSRDKHG